MLYQLGGGGVGTGTSSGGSAGGSTGSGSSSSSSHSPEALQQVTSQTHMGLTNSYNLGGADFYPNTSGKVRCHGMVRMVNHLIARSLQVGSNMVSSNLPIKSAWGSVAR